MPVAASISATVPTQKVRVPVASQGVRAGNASVVATTNVPQTSVQRRSAVFNAVPVVLSNPRSDVALEVSSETPIPQLPGPIPVSASVDASITQTPKFELTDRSKKEHNSVTIKHDTRVKDAAGAISKVLNRINNLLVTALRLEASFEGLNRAVKALSVARKYLQDQDPDSELTYIPFNRSNINEELDPHLFGFIAFKTRVEQELISVDKTILNVSKGSDINKMANAIMSIVLDRGQAVLKAGGPDAIFIAISAIINARKRLKKNHDCDAMLVSSFITEDTVGELGRESKFLKFNVLKCPINGPPIDIHPSLSSYEGPHVSYA